MACGNPIKYKLQKVVDHWNNLLWAKYYLLSPMQKTQEW